MTLILVTCLQPCKLSAILNSADTTKRNKLMSDLSATLTTDNISNVSISQEVITESLSSLGRDKCDSSDLSSNHFIIAAPVISGFLAQYFTVVLRHGYMPIALRNCALKPIPKPHKDRSNSDNYRPIALAPNLSKVLERAILLCSFLCPPIFSLQFGFKSGFSTDLCTGLLKCTVSKHIQRGSSVYGCLLDASKAFDRFKLDWRSRPFLNEVGIS